jgi:hypothetical protein
MVRCIDGDDRYSGNNINAHLIPQADFSEITPLIVAAQKGTVILQRPGIDSIV